MDKEEVIEYTFDKEFHDLVTDKENISHVTERFLNNLIDDITLGIIFDIHRKFKTNGFCLDVDDFSTSEIKILNKDGFGQHKIKKSKEPPCKCPQCGRAFAAQKIAGHLAQCMGLRKGRNNYTRRASATNNKESENPQPVNTNSADDDDDDLDWSPGMKKEKKKKKGNKIKKKKGLASYC